jgi:hypothetical protein
LQGFQLLWLRSPRIAPGGCDGVFWTGVNHAIVIIAVGTVLARNPGRISDIKATISALEPCLLRIERLLNDFSLQEGDKLNRVEWLIG